jgi:hypothetical protein
MTISTGMEALISMVLAALVVFLMVRGAARVYRDKPEVWRGQAFLSGRQGAVVRARRRDHSVMTGGTGNHSEGCA